jgi:hypothetical protein
MDDKEFSKGVGNLFASNHVLKLEVAFVQPGSGLLRTGGPPRRDGFDAPPQFADLISPWGFLLLR